MEHLPFIRHPEVAKQENQDELKEALQAEKLAFEYKFKQEELLSIFDEVKEYLHYDDIANKFPEWGEKIAARKSANKEKGLTKTSYKHILFEDFQELWHGDLKNFITLLTYCVKESEARRVSKEGKEGKNKERSEAYLKQEVNLRTIGTVTRIGYLLKNHYSQLEKELSNFTEDELLKISAYAQGSKGKVKDAVKEIRKIKKGMSVAKASKSVESARKPSEVAKIYHTSEKEVKDLNSLLEDVFKKELGENITLGIEEKYDELGNIINHDFVTAYVNYNHEMKDLHQMLNQGKIVETGYIKELIEKALPALKKNPPSIVYFHGDFGTGKTALAVHISRTRFGKEPIIVAGSKYIDPDRFTEEFRIQKLSNIDFLNSIAKQLGEEEFSADTPTNVILEKIIGKKNELRERIINNYVLENYVHSKHPEKEDDGAIQKEIAELREFVTETLPEELAELHKDVKEMRPDPDEFMEQNRRNVPESFLKDIDTQLDNLFSSSVQGRYVLGAMYRAMKDGAPLIIDEANAISPDVLIAFNDALTKRIGERIKVRSDEGEITIKEGYCIMWTGNTGERYKQARFNDMDPATYSRIVPIQMKYLPQSREISNMDTLLKRLNLDKVAEKTFVDEQEVLEFVKNSKEKAGTDQIFQVMLVKLLNQRMGSELLVRQDDPYSVFKDVYRLSMGSRIIMDLFEGNATNLPSFTVLDKLIGSNVPTVVMEKLQKSNLTMRELMDNIIGGYLDDGCSMDIEYYLFKFVQKYEQYPEEQAIIFSVLRTVGFFEPSDGWPNVMGVSWSGDTKANLRRFQDMLRMNPVDQVNKYKKIQKNGEYLSLLNTNGAYELKYFSSLEMLQLLFGYLPPRKKEEYETVQREHKKIFASKEMEASKQELINSIRETRGLLHGGLFQTSEEVGKFTSQLKEIRVSNPAFMESATDEDFFMEANKFYDLILQLVKGSGKITEEDYQAAESTENIEEKARMVNELLRKTM